eukprot:scaffold1168_cov167-Amphora_coffeaeformis.AAC.37
MDYTNKAVPPIPTLEIQRAAIQPRSNKIRIFRSSTSHDAVKRIFSYYCNVRFYGLVTLPDEK